MDEEQTNQFDLDDIENLSDEELQEAFAAGLLKPGLNVRLEKKECKNNINGLKLKLNEIRLNLNWIERLDLINSPAPLAPETYDAIVKKNSQNVIKLKNQYKFNGAFQSKDCVNDFEREMLFHRQAQSAVIEGIARLKSLGILTKRPDDYLAEMAKSDKHMHKVCQNLAARQTAAAQSQRNKELRRQKKLGKKAQIEAKLKQASEKKKMLNEVKKFRKGLTNDLSFLGNKKEKKNVLSAKAQKKRSFKNDKFGYGGKKRGSKRNTRDSSNYVGSLTKKGKNQRGNKTNKRPGKSKRIKKRSKK